MSFPKIKYLQITHIPFFREQGGEVVTDEMWINDLKALVKSVGPLKICAPELKNRSELVSWGPTLSKVPGEIGIEFVGFPPMQSRRDLWNLIKIRRILKNEVLKADLVHSSNWYSPYLCLYYGHNLAVKHEKRTLFVIAEDFYDMLAWEWVRVAKGWYQKYTRSKMLKKVERYVLNTTSTASLTFFHTPAVVKKYRLNALNAYCIRQPTHETIDVISEKDLSKKCEDITNVNRLIIISASRHKPLKGLDFLIHAIHLLKQRGVEVEARIYGDGPFTEYLKSITQKLSLNDRVHFLGPVPPGKAIYQAIARGHIFSMPHRTTDFGRAFYDAMSAGTPVIAFASDASNDTVRHGIDGLLAPLDDIFAYSLAIEYLHQNRKLLVQMAIESRRRALCETQSAWQQFRADRVNELFNT